MFDRLPAARLRPLLAVPKPPPGKPKVEPGGVKHVKVADVQWQIRKGKLVAPVRPPARARMIVDPAPPQYFGEGGSTGIVGGIDRPGLGTDGVVGSILTSTVEAVEPPPPAPVVTPVKAKPERIKLGGNIVEARLIDRVIPPYPALARRARIEGAVRLRAVISRDGRVQEISLIEGHPLLVPAAVEAVRQWRYRPTMLNGEPVEVDTEITVFFTLSR
ncbi:MAG: energy transducer TonB [Rhodospirillales bacterium]